MYICSYSRRCDNYSCFHKEQHELDEYNSCSNSACTKFLSEVVECIEVGHIT